MRLNIFRSAVQGEQEVSPEAPYQLSGIVFFNTMYEKMELGFSSLYSAIAGLREINVEINEKNNSITFGTKENTITLNFETDSDNGKINGICGIKVLNIMKLNVELIEDNYVAINHKSRKILFKDSEKNDFSNLSCSLPILLDRILFYM
jgi:hypothetical protein